MSTAVILAPASAAECAEIVRATPRILGLGAATKPRLSELPPEFARLSVCRMQGIVEYDPAEFTVTALAGTPIRDLAETLARQGQYLPFDPLLVDAGATFGGTVAAGTHGPGRFRYGGIRDFILGVQLIDGLGRLLRLGGKVVKNAAGFDVPKFVVGSLGRFGILTEITCKVFPRPASTLTLRLRMRDAGESTSTMLELGRGRWEMEAVDVPPDSADVLVRLAGPTEALPALGDDILSRWPGARLPTDEAGKAWADLREASWTHPDGVWFKIPTPPSRSTQVAALVARMAGARLHRSVGGNAAYVSLPDHGQVPDFAAGLRSLGLQALTLKGKAPLWLGLREPAQIIAGVKRALDPDGRFPGLEN